MKQFDVMHIHPSGTRGAPKFLYLPAGLIPMMNELQAHDFKVISVNEPLELLRKDSRSLDDWLPEYRAPLFALDIHWHEHLHSGLCIAERIKQLYPKSRVVVGGLTASAFAEDLLQLSPAVDYVIKGYGEGQLLKLIRQLKSSRRRPPERGVIVAQTPPDLDAYDYVNSDWMLHAEDYRHCAIDTWMENASVWWLKTGLGCGLNCAFCGGSRSAQKITFGNSRVVFREANRLAADIVALSERGIQRVALTQDPSVAPERYWRRLHEAIRKYPRRPAVYIEAVATPSDDYLADFAESFDLKDSLIALWPMCADETQRACFGKPLRDQEVFRCLRTMRRLKIPCVLYMTRNLEPSTAKIRAGHERFLKRALEAYGNLGVLESYVIVDPASRIARNPKRFGVEVSLTTPDDYLQRTSRRAAGEPYDRLGYQLMTK